MSDRGPVLYRMTPLELAVGWVFGTDAEVAPSADRASPRDLLERQTLEQLRQSPCFVAFSGGRDSSAVLAVATAVARRHGLPLPVPVTRVFPAHADTDETAWQTAVIRHLGLDHWVRLPLHDECDLIGPIAGDVLRRFGVVWPFAAFTSVPVFEVARGGRVLTGEGGDNVFGAHRASVIRHLGAGPLRQRLRAARVLPSAVAPRRMRLRYLRRVARRRTAMPWLRATAHGAASILLAEELAEAPLSWAQSIRRESRRRSWRAGSATIQRIAGTHDVVVVHPLLDDGFLEVLGAWGHRFGPMSRTQIMQDLFGDLLPPPVLARTTKAAFNTTVVGAASRRFAEQWDGGGVDPQLVDVEQLRDAWLASRPHPSSFGLLQGAWLATSDHRLCRVEPHGRDDR
jgi:asparagine synthase (glutamine-hydrolysing)